MDGHLGGKYSADQLTDLIEELWDEDSLPYVVFTGGEPLLQLDEQLVGRCHEKRIIVAIETNGTLLPPKNLDWICMSPKANTDIILKKGNELKIVFPQLGVDPRDFADYNFEHFYLQPMYGEFTDQNTVHCETYIKKHPQWKLSLQMHKVLGIP
jgi:organic radical activating enzyme